MDQLPAGVQRELDAALQRTGDTPQLQRARSRIEWLLTIGPENVERFTAGIYQRMDSDKMS